MTVRVTEEHHIWQAQRAAKSLARSLALPQVATYSIATSVSELASNLFFHATCGGTITLAVLRQDGRVGVEVVAEDEGPGILDIELAMQEGYSTSTPEMRALGFGAGMGLPTIKRNAGRFEIESTVGKSTLVRLYFPV